MEKKKPSGMAPEERVAHRKMLTKVITVTVTPGKKQATRQHTCAGAGGRGGAWDGSGAQQGEQQPSDHKKRAEKRAEKVEVLLLGGPLAGAWCRPAHSYGATRPRPGAPTLNQPS